MKKLVVVLLVIIILVLAGVGAAFFYLNSGQEETNNNQNAVYVNVTKENFALIMEQNQFIKALPDNAVISLKFGEDYYIIKKSSVQEEKINDYDFEISIPDKYLSMIGNLCSAIETAKANGDMGWDSKLSKTQLMWKYKSMLKYRNCFGF